MSWFLWFLCGFCVLLSGGLLKFFFVRLLDRWVGEWKC